MREILFKAKRIDNGEWVEGYVVKFGKESSDEKDRFGILDKTILTALIKHTNGKVTMMKPDYAYHNIEIVEVNPSTICQYTGLTDKNGNKIWENDVLEWKYENAPSDYYECVWIKDECAFAFRHCKYRNHYENPVDCYDDNYTDAFWMDVIGNIFDNPELLEGAQT